LIKLKNYNIDYEKEKHLFSFQGKVIVFLADIEENRSMAVPSATSNPTCSTPVIQEYDPRYPQSRGRTNDRPDIPRVLEWNEKSTPQRPVLIRPFLKNGYLHCQYALTRFMDIDLAEKIPVKPIARYLTRGSCLRDSIRISINDSCAGLPEFWRGLLNLFRTGKKCKALFSSALALLFPSAQLTRMIRIPQ